MSQDQKQEYKPDGYSTLEVDYRNAHPPEPIKQGDGSDAPEAFDQTPKEVVPPAAFPQNKAPTICGLRMRTFWILLAAAILIVIGIAVGVGVGVGTKSNSSSGSSSSASTEPYHQGVASFSKLAANNYTDADGVAHSQLYYQDNSLSIYEANFNNGTGQWQLSQVIADNNRTDMTPRSGTPIASGNWWNDTNTGNRSISDFRVFWTDANNTIRAVYVLDQGVADSWSTLDQLDNWITMDANSSLVEYIPMCNQTTSCNSADFIGFEAPNSEGVRLQWPFSNGDNGRLVADNGVATDDGTAMAVAPIPKIAKRNDPYPRTALYLIGGNQLEELYGGAFINWRNTGINVGGQKILVDTGAQLAAMTEYRLDDFNEQIFITQKSGGVKMVYMNGTDWYMTSSVPSMENVAPLSPIAANQLGRVYAFENTTDGRQIVEWERISGSTPTFNRIGIVNTSGNAT